MNEDYEGFADIDGERVPVICYYVMGGYKPMGLYIFTPDGVDITECVIESEYDRLYNEVCADVVSDMADAADMMTEGER